MLVNAILPGVVLLGIVIFFHELGHFLVAKWRGITVTKFSMGMGPEMVGFTSGGTRYCLSWIPLGGFVQMAGDHPNDDGSIPEGGPEQFLTHHWFGRMLVAVAGPAANLVLAFAIYVVLYAAVGVGGREWPSVLGPPEAGSPAERAGLREGDVIQAVAGGAVSTWTDVERRAAKSDSTRALALRIRRGDSLFTVTAGPAERRAFLASLDRPHPPVVGGLASGQPAYLAGLKEGDRILAIDGKSVRQFGDVRRLLGGKAGRELVARVRRGDTEFDVTLRPAQFPGDTSNQGFIGIEEVGPTGPKGERLRYSFAESVPLAFQQTLIGTVQVYDGLWTTITRFWQVREQMGGPIFIAQMASDAARKGFEYWLNLMAMISIAVMAFNLLPIPLLDGGHIFLALLQAVRRRAMSARGYMRFMRVGLIFVGLLFVFIIAQDVMRPLRRMQALGKAPRETTTVAPAPR